MIQEALAVACSKTTSRRSPIWPANRHYAPILPVNKVQVFLYHGYVGIRSTLVAFFLGEITLSQSVDVFYKTSAYQQLYK